MKWCLVAAGIKDLARPPEKLSVSQNIGWCDEAVHMLTLNGYSSALTATGFIWVRYSFVIIPVNYSLAAVRPLKLTLTHFPNGSRRLTSSWG
jgi:mitochondrial pyruvate carrier 2